MALKLRHPAWHLDALVDRLTRRLHTGRQSTPRPSPFPAAHMHAHGGRANVIPQRQAQLTLKTQRHVIHGLTGQHPARRDLLAGTVGHQVDGVALLQQTNAKL